MNRQRYLAAGVIAISAIVLTACSTPSDSGNGDEGNDKSVAHVLASPLGDQSFNDDAETGITALKADGWTTETLQADANNPAQWKSNLQSVSGGDYSIVVTGGSTIIDTLNEVAPQYPDQHYIMYDDVVDQPNVAAIVFKQNEGSFLAGVLAASVTTDTADFPLANDQKIVGVVGGMDIPVIQDFIAGFKAGTAAVDPEVQVLTSFVGDFTDSQKGYDQAQAMYAQGADVVYQVAGGAGTGVLQASADSNAYSIGVDSNQNPLQKGHILASMLKHVGDTIKTAVEEAAAGTLEYGKTTAFGLADNSVGLTFDDNGDIVPQSIIDSIEDYKQQVIDGTITVPSVTS